MDARWTNIFTERLWRSVKYEEVYLKDYAGVPDAIANLKNYFRLYNFERPHQSLNNQTPAAIYFGIPKTTAGYQNLSRDFDVFLVGDAMLATFPAADTPRFATNATVAFAALDHLITQVSWIHYKDNRQSQK